MTVAEAIGAALARRGVRVCFGLLGSGNLTFTNALRDGGAAFYGARHEGGAICMADGYARVAQTVGVCSVHQGPGLTNAITGLTEAVKSHTPLLLLAADTPAGRVEDNFYIEQAALVEAVGAAAERVKSAETAVADVERAYRRAVDEQRAVVLMIPLDVQVMEAWDEESGDNAVDVRRPEPPADAVENLADRLAGASRPLIIAGRGAVRAGAGPDLRALGERLGAILATSAPANGLFADEPWNVGICGGFSAPLAADLIRRADVIVAFGAGLNRWTTRSGQLIGAGAYVAQVDVEPESLGRHGPVDAGIVGDAGLTALSLLQALQRGRPNSNGWRTPEVRETIAKGGWRDEPFEESDSDWIDPRRLSIALEDLLPRDRTIVVDSGHFMGFPSMYLSVPDARAFVFPQAFQCVGLGLGNAIGAHIARPDRLTVATVGDGGALLALQELETLGRLQLPVLVVVYNDAAYGAEVHHFRMLGQAVDLVQFPDTDFAALGRAAGCEGITVRSVGDLDQLEPWLEHRSNPLVLDAKVDPNVRADWLEEAFRH